MAEKKEKVNLNNDKVFRFNYKLDYNKSTPKEASDFLKNLYGTFVKQPTGVYTCKFDDNTTKCDCQTCNKEKHYDDYSNVDEPILYIIVNKDAMIDASSKYTTISHLTSKMVNDSSFLSNLYVDYWLESHNGYGNTVILECDEKTLYDNCMSEYDNLAFVKYVEDCDRVAHNNWKLSCPVHMGVAFFGLKKEMPKWVKKLKLMK